MGNTHKNGFTIVEILVIVAVIAILASITIFAFGSWRARTAKTEVQNDLRNSNSAIKNYQTFNNALPNAATFANTYTPSRNVTLTYALRGDNASYCLKGQSNVESSVVWYVDSLVSTEPTTTACS
jgi:prepilin-type N-terminal cleavage/methylation domain-containing protein